MYDASLYFSERADALGNPLAEIGVQPKQYVLMTCHRAENTDDASRLTAILRAANETASRMPVVFPVHPRTRGRLSELGIKFHSQLILAEPVSYMDMLTLERNAALITTDSGGVQKEAFFFQVPCVTTRDETEWRETVEVGANILSGADFETICSAVDNQLNRSDAIPDAGPFYGGGLATYMTANLTRQVGLEGFATRKAAS